MTQSMVVGNAAEHLGPPQACVPGPFFFMVTVGVLATGLYGTSLPAWNVGLVLPAFLMSVVIGLIWMIFFTLAARETRLRMSRRTWARWLGIPDLGFSCLALMLTGLPLQVRFELSRPALEQAAARFASGQTVGPGWIGLIPIDSVETMDGATLFVVPGTGGFLASPCGLAYAGGQRPDLGSRLYGEIADGWWVWRESW
jgi:hypothetical protein